MASKYTEHYGLCQWAAGDKVVRTEFNADNARIDAALAAEAEARTAADAQLVQALEKKADASAVSSLSSTVSGQASSLARKGNCQLYTTSYVGKGTYGTGNPTSLTFSSKPQVVFVAGPQGIQATFIYGQDRSFGDQAGGGASDLAVTWSGYTLSWSNHMSANRQLNENGYNYLVVALLSL